MGMFDYVAVAIDCPECGAALTGFQTKDGNCFLELVHPNSVLNFYTACDECGTWVEFRKPPPVPTSPPLEPLLEEDVLALGFIKTVERIKK